MNYCYLETPIGTLLIAGDEQAIHRIEFPRRGRPGRPEAEWREAQRGPVAEAVRQLREYFAGKRTEFDLPLAPDGTDFQRNVWRRLQEIYIDEVPVLPLYFRPDPFVMPKWLTGIEPTGHQYTTALWVENWRRE